MTMTALLLKRGIYFIYIIIYDGICITVCIMLMSLCHFEHNGSKFRDWRVTENVVDTFFYTNKSDTFF